jgi:hypothetical protein
VSEPETLQNRPSSEAVSARAVYDDIVHRINTLQATLDPDEKIALSVGGVAIDAVGLEAPRFGSRGAIIRAAL